MTEPAAPDLPELSHREVLAILDAVARADVDYFELRLGSSVLVTGRGQPPATLTGPPLNGTPGHAPSVPAPSSVPPPAVPAAEPVGTSAAPADEAREDLVDVTAPMVGVFYRAPEPGAPSFVEVGAPVTEGATVGLVEVMKMFNGVTAPVSGTVVEVIAANEEFVEFGQVVMRLRPEAR